MSNENEMKEFEYSQSLADAEAPVPLPKGPYPFEIKKAELKKSKSGNTILNVSCFIEPDNYPVDFTEGHPDGTTLIFGRLVVRDDAQSRYQMRKFLESVGAPLSSKLDPNDLIGRTGTLEVDHDTWEGVLRATIAKILTV
jgi:hypothetical protein